MTKKKSFKLSLKRLSINEPVWISVAFVELELNLLDVAGHVLVVVGLDVDRPVVGVAVGLPLLPEALRNVSEDDRLDDRDASNSDRFRRDGFVSHFCC